MKPKPKESSTGYLIACRRYHGISRQRTYMHECVRGDDRVAWRSANNTYNRSWYVRRGVRTRIRADKRTHARVHRTGCNLGVHTQCLTHTTAYYTPRDEIRTCLRVRKRLNPRARSETDHLFNTKCSDYYTQLSLSSDFQLNATLRSIFR